MPTVRELLVELGIEVPELSKTEKDINRLKSRLKTLEKQSSDARKKLRAEFGALGKAMRSMGKAAAVAFVAGTAGAAAFVVKVANVGDQAAKNARKLGLTAEAVQELDFAATLSGTSIETMRTGMQALGRGLNDAITKGTGPAAEAFEQLGISLDDTRIQSGDLEQVFPLIADKLAQLPDGMEKTALSMKLFSRSGAELIPLLNGGAAGLAELREEARNTGAVISNEAAADMEQFNDDLERMKKEIGGVVTQMVADFTPAINETLNAFREWFLANRQIIKQNIEKFITGMVDAAKALKGPLMALIDALPGLVSAFASFVDVVGGPGGAAAVAVALRLAFTGMPGLILAIGVAAATATQSLLTFASEALFGVRKQIAQLRKEAAQIRADGDRAQKEHDAKAATIKAGNTVANFSALTDAEAAALPQAEIESAFDTAIQGATTAKERNSIAQRTGAFNARRHRQQRADAKAAEQKRKREVRLSGSAGGKGFDKGSRLGQAGGRKKGGGGGGGGGAAKEKTFGELLGLGSTGNNLGAFNSRAENPVLGTTINRFDFAPVMNNEFNLRQRGGESAEDFADRVVAEVDKKQQQMLRQVHQHFSGAPA